MLATSCDSMLTQETMVYNVEDDVAGIMCQAIPAGVARRGGAAAQGGGAPANAAGALQPAERGGGAAGSNQVDPRVDPKVDPRLNPG